MPDKPADPVALHVAQTFRNLGGWVPAWDDLSEVMREVWLRQAKLMIAAHNAALAEAGMVIVPKEPTEAMHAAANREWDGRMSARSAGVWRAMIEAAP